MGLRILSQETKGRLYEPCEKQKNGRLHRVSEVKNRIDRYRKNVTGLMGKREVDIAALGLVHTASVSAMFCVVHSHQYSTATIGTDWRAPCLCLHKCAAGSMMHVPFRKVSRGACMGLPSQERPNQGCSCGVAEKLPDSMPGE